MKYHVHGPPLCDHGFAAFDEVSGRIDPTDGTDAAVAAPESIGRRLDATGDERPTGGV